ncbi:hypothetical protein SLA2020_221090 [Shorea laevis]
MEKMSREEKPANEDTKSQDRDLVRGPGAADGRWVEKAIGRGRCKAEKGKKYGAIGRWRMQSGGRGWRGGIGRQRVERN